MLRGIRGQSNNLTGVQLSIRVALRNVMRGAAANARGSTDWVFSQDSSSTPRYHLTYSPYCASALTSEPLRFFRYGSCSSLNEHNTVVSPIRVSSPLTCLLLRCTTHHDPTMCSTDKSRFLPGSKDAFYRAPRTKNRGLDGFLLEKPVASSGAMDDVRGVSRLYIVL